MRLKTILGVLLCSVLLLSSCKDDINITRSGTETAVVYGLLNASENTHYIKINKAFISDGNSLEIAKIPDSNYFSNVVAKVSEYKNNALLRSWTLYDTIIENKEQGIFYYPYQKVYKFTTTSAAPLRTDCIYHLDIDINNGAFSVHSETELIKDIKIVAPSQNGSYIFATSNIAQYGYGQPTVSAEKGTAAFGALRLFITFEEFRGTNVTEKSFIWNVAEVSADETASKSKIEARASGQIFYEKMKENVTNDPTITKRRLKSITFEATGGSKDLADYIALNKPSSSIAQNKPIYSNLTATNGRKAIGIFSSRGTARQEKQRWSNFGSAFLKAIDMNSMKELYEGGITGGLLFCDDNPEYSVPTPKNWYCP